MSLGLTRRHAESLDRIVVPAVVLASVDHALDVNTLTGRIRIEVGHPLALELDHHVVLITLTVLFP